MEFKALTKLKKGDKVAIVSPSFAAPGRWPHVYELGLKRLHEEFGLKPVEYPTTKIIGSSKEDRSRDLIAAFEDPEIKAVITTLGGDDQVTYVGKLPKEPFANNPKPFFGYSDNTQLVNFLWLCGVPSFYGGCIFTEYAEQKEINKFTEKYLRISLFEQGRFELNASDEFNDIGLNWADEATLTQPRRYQVNEGWYWDGSVSAKGVLWGGCLEAIDETLRNGLPIPELKEFENNVLMLETSEEMPDEHFIFRLFRGLGERGILDKVKGVLIGRPKAWEFDKQLTDEQKVEYKNTQREIIIKTVREYNPKVTIVQNMDFGHTAPQIPMPYGGEVEIDCENKKIFAVF